MTETKEGYRAQAAAARGSANNSFWQKCKNYAKEHPVKAAMLGTAMVVGVAAIVAGSVMSGGALPAAAGAAVGISALIGVDVSVGAMVTTLGAVFTACSAIAAKLTVQTTPSKANSRENVIKNVEAAMNIPEQSVKVHQRSSEPSSQRSNTSISPSPFPSSAATVSEKGRANSR